MKHALSRQTLRGVECAAPVLSVFDKDGTLDASIVAPLIRVGLPDCPAFWEMAVSLEKGAKATIELHCWSEATRKQLKTMVDGLSIFETLREARGGRPRDNREEQIAEYKRMLPEAILKARAKRGDRFTLADLADGFPYEVDTLSSRMKMAGDTMTKLKRRRGGRVPR